PAAARSELEAGGKNDAEEQPTDISLSTHGPPPLALTRLPPAVGIAHDHVVRRADHKPCTAADRRAAATRDADADGHPGRAGDAALPAFQSAGAGAPRSRA